MEEKNISREESLSIIQQMIQTAKIEQKDDGRGWIVWGWMLFFASVLTVLNMRNDWFQTWFFWNAFGILVLVIFLYETFAKMLKRKVRVKTYTKDLFNRLNIGFFISLMFIILAMNQSLRLEGYPNAVPALSPLVGFPLLINLYAFWILIYGTALNFRPSIIGAYVTWGLGIGALFMQTFEMVMIMHALAALAGYIIPGYMANSEFKKTRRKDNLVNV